MCTIGVRAGMADTLRRPGVGSGLCVQVSHLTIFPPPPHRPTRTAASLSLIASQPRKLSDRTPSRCRGNHRHRAFVQLRGEGPARRRKCPRRKERLIIVAAVTCVPACRHGRQSPPAHAQPGRRFRKQRVCAWSSQAESQRTQSRALAVGCGLGPATGVNSCAHGCRNSAWSSYG
jgi:hypothetical protein